MSMSNFSQEFFSKDYFFGRKNSSYHNYNHWDNDRYWKSIIKAVKQYQMRGKALDVGCAFGFLLKRLQPYFDELHGVDISDFAIQQAEKETPSAKFNKVDLNTQELPYPDHYFNLITALDVLEHTQSVEKSLGKITQKLASDGYLIISIPIRDSWAGKIFNVIDKDASHVSVLSRKELFAIINKADLKILEKNYFLNMVFFKLKGIPVDLELVLQKRSLKSKFYIA